VTVHKRRWGWWARRRPTTRAAAIRERGSATVELAMSLPALVLLMLAGLTAVSAVRTQLECVDAAREAAREAARGAPAPRGPYGAGIAVVREGDQIRATVRVHRAPLGPRLPGFEVSATAVAAVEPEE
jgi:TadE-like protein